MGVLFLVTVQNLCPDYGLLLELHTLTLAARSYALLTDDVAIETSVHQIVF